MNRLTWWADLQWITIPRQLISRSAGFRGLAGDGHALVTMPLLAALLPGLALATGLIAGLGRLGYDDVYTESTVLLALFVGIGAFSGQLGTLVVTGLALGDLISTMTGGQTGAPLRTGSGFWFSGPFATGPLGAAVHEWLPRIITYLLLAAVVMVLPRAARAVVTGVGRGRSVPAPAAWALVSGLLTVMLWLGTDSWVAAAPTLVRPVFTWTGSTPTVEAMSTLQESGGVIVAAAVIATLARQVLIGWTMLPGPARERLTAAEQQGPKTAATARPGPRRQVPVAILTSLLATLAMAGILERAWLWVAVFLILLTIRLIHTGLITVPGLPQWQQAVSLAPAWARLIALWLLSRVIVSGLSPDLIGSYTALAIFVLVSIVAVFAVFPGEPLPPEDTTPAPSESTPLQPGGAA